MGSLIMEAARATQVPAGSALAVDRDKFSAYITEKIQNHPLISVVEEEITELPLLSKEQAANAILDKCLTL
jgi:methylenetetrahydrofolate--tRNA-(uracil-5-)-methyltransferase